MKNWIIKIIGTSLSLFVTALLIGVVALSVGSLIAKGPVGEHAGKLAQGNAFFNPQQGSVVDEAGTKWNLIDDVYTRMLTIGDTADFNERVTVSSSGAKSDHGGIYETNPSSANYSRDNLGFALGWTLAVPTATVSNIRIAVRVYNPYSNTQKILLNYATGFTSGLLSYPSTGTFTDDIDPGEFRVVLVSSGMHPVIMSSGDVSTESMQVTQIN